MAIEKFQEWHENRHEYQEDWKKRTGGKMAGCFCTYETEEIFYAFDILLVRMLGSHEIQDVTEPHLFAMFCPFCRDVLAQGLKGRYDYLDGITIGQSCLHLRQAYTSWDIHKNPGWSHYLPIPSHLQSPRAAPFLVAEYELFINKLKDLAGKKITNSDIKRGIEIMNNVRRTMKDIFEYRKQDNPPITGLESMYRVCFQFFTDAREWLPVAEEAKKELETRKLDRDSGKRLMLIGSENDDMEFIKMVETLGERESIGATCAFDRPLSAKFLEAAENFGFARDLCAYMRNYWGSIIKNQYALGGEFPKADFAFSQHICCSHAKWYQNACELEGGDVPFYVIDVGPGAYPPFEPERCMSIESNTLRISYWTALNGCRR